MTPFEVLKRVRAENPELRFENSYIKFDNRWLYIGYPKSARPMTGFGQVFSYNGKTGKILPYAIYGEGLSHFHDFMKAASKPIRLPA